MKLGYMIKKGLFYFFNKPIIIKEQALEKMMAIIPGWLEPGHLYCFDYAIKNLPNDKPIIEIGTFAGLSTNTILYYLKKHKRSNKLLTTDWYLNDISDDEVICNIKKGRSLCDYLKELFIRNVALFNPDANIYSSDLPSDDFFAAWNKSEISNLHGGTFKPERQISFAYIDGNHVYDFAKRDFENIDRLLVSGGFILFDDSADYTNWGSKTVAQEAVATERYKIVKKNPHYFIQKI